MNVLIMGQSGLLGSYLKRTADKKDELFLPERNELNIKDTQKFYEYIKKNKIDLCINAAGLTNVYLCETNVEEAFKVNAYAPAECAKICREEKSRFVHVSTGFVFDGKKISSYVESDIPSPINAYGESKYRGELFILRDNPDALILRTDELFGRSASSAGHNVIAYIIGQLLSGKTATLYPIKTSPTYGYDLAKFIWSLKREPEVKGILHAVNKGAFTYAEVTEIAARLTKTKASVRTRNDVFKYKVPQNCSLESEKIKSVNLPEMRCFEDALKDSLREFL